MAQVPSLDWFRKVRDVYNSDSSLNKGGGGACHTNAAFKVDGQVYLIAFEGQKIGDISAAKDSDLRDVDFVIEMPSNVWRDMVKSVQQNGRAELRYTLNSLDLSQPDGIAHSPTDDQYRQDLFYRYNQNFQDFFDASSRVETTFG